MDKTREIIRYGQRSVVEIENEGKVIKYVTVTNYDGSKEIGSRWDWGHYYDICGDVTQEEALKKAILDLYNIENPLNNLFKEKDAHDRTKIIASNAIAALVENLAEDDKKAILERLELTEDEAELYDVKEILYPTLYNVIEVKLIREQRATVKIVVPSDKDVDVYNADDYIDYIDNVEPDEDGDWEVDDIDTEEKNVSREKIEENYSGEDIWNYDDIYY